MQKNSFNRVILIGHLGANPEGRYTQQGQATATLTLATNESWANKDGKMTEHTEWHNIVAWNKLAEFSKEYINKGQLIYIEGRIHTQSWVDKNDVRQKRVEIVCETITPLEWKKNK